VRDVVTSDPRVDSVISLRVDEVTGQDEYEIDVVVEDNAAGSEELIFTV